MRLRASLVSILCMALTAASYGQRDKLSVGDPAPGLDIEAWVKGNETSIKTGNVYLLVFWETSNAGFRAIAPLLSRIQEDNADLGMVVIGITPEEKDVVEPWLRRSGGDLNFAIALDRRSGTQRAWVTAADYKDDDLPVIFLVDRQSRIAYIATASDRDHAQELTRIERLVIRNRYDPKLEKAARPMLEGARNARKSHTYRIALKQYDEVIDLSPTIFADIALERFEMVIADMHEPKNAYAYARDKLMGEFYGSDAEALTQLAEKIAVDPDIRTEDRDLDLALEAATAANKLLDHPATYASLALVHFHRGETAEAIRLQKIAMFRARPRAKPEYKRVLKTYQEAERRSGLRTR